MAAAAANPANPPDEAGESAAVAPLTLGSLYKPCPASPGGLLKAVLS